MRLGKTGLLATAKLLLSKMSRPAMTLVISSSPQVLAQEGEVDDVFSGLDQRRLVGR